MQYPFQQVDVFSQQSCMGNPVAVFLDSANLSTADMQKIACWTNLSETTFVSPSEKADYKLRIFTPSIELPFAGHPTLGTAFALKKAGILNKTSIVQECAFGFINIDFQDDRVFFELPHYFYEDLRIDNDLSVAMGIKLEQCRLITTGPKWIVAELRDGSDLFSVTIDAPAFVALMKKLNADGATIYTVDSNNDVHLRTFFPADDVVIEDPVCGSGNAAVAVHVLKTGKMSPGSQYQAFQGKSLKRDGRIFVILGEKIKVGGSCNVVFEGQATFS